MDAVAHVHRRARVGAQKPHGLLHRLGMGFGVLHLVRADQHVHQGLELHQRETAKRPRAVLARDQTGRDPVGLERAHDLHYPRVHRHHAIVVLQVVLPIGGDQGLQRLGIVAPGGELRRERCADAGEPLLVAARRQPVGGEGVMIAVQDQADRVDEGAVEVEEHGANGRHGRNLLRRLITPARTAGPRRVEARSRSSHPERRAAGSPPARTCHPAGRQAAPARATPPLCVPVQRIRVPARVRPEPRDPAFAPPPARRGAAAARPGARPGLRPVVTIGRPVKRRAGSGSAPRAAPARPGYGRDPSPRPAAPPTAAASLSATTDSSSVHAPSGATQTNAAASRSAPLVWSP